VAQRTLVAKEIVLRDQWGELEASRIRASEIQATNSENVRCQSHSLRQLALHEPFSRVIRSARIAQHRRSFLIRPVGLAARPAWRLHAGNESFGSACCSVSERLSRPFPARKSVHLIDRSPSGDTPHTYRGAATLLKRKAAKLPGGTGEMNRAAMRESEPEGQSQCLSSKPSSLASSQPHSFWRQSLSSAIAKSCTPAASKRKRRGPWLSGDRSPVTQALLPALIAAGNAHIVNVASDAGRVGSSGETAYAAAKGGMIAFTKSLAREKLRLPGPDRHAVARHAAREPERRLRQGHRIPPAWQA